MLTQPETPREERSNQPQSVYRKLNFYRRIKGLYHISTNVTRLLIINQGHRPMSTAGDRRPAGVGMTERDLYAPASAH